MVELHDVTPLPFPSQGTERQQQRQQLQQQLQQRRQAHPSEPFSGPDPPMGMDAKPIYSQGYPGPPSAMGGMQGGYGPGGGGGGSGPIPGQSGAGFNPMMNQVGQQGGFPGMGPMGAMAGHPRAGMMHPRMMSATKPLRMQLQQRLQGVQVWQP